VSPQWKDDSVFPIYTNSFSHISQSMRRAAKLYKIFRTELRSLKHRRHWGPYSKELLMKT